MPNDYYHTKEGRDEWTVHGRRHHIQIDRTEAPTGRADRHGEDILQDVYYVHDRSEVIDTSDQYDTDPHGFTRLKDALRYAVAKLKEYDEKVDPRMDGGGRMKRDLTPQQESALLRKLATGDFGVHKWSTIRVLFDKGYVEEDPGTRLVAVTDKGREYCDLHHQDIRI